LGVGQELPLPRTEGKLEQEGETDLQERFSRHASEEGGGDNNLVTEIERLGGKADANDMR